MKNTKIILAVNGTIMKGYELHNNLVEENAIFIKTCKTTKEYILYSINDKNPAMVKADSLNKKNANAITVELYELSANGIMNIFAKEPAGLVLGKITLEDNQEVIGILAENYVIKNQKNITKYGGWTEYLKNK